MKRGGSNYKQGLILVECLQSSEPQKEDPQQPQAIQGLF